MNAVPNDHIGLMQSAPPRRDRLLGNELAAPRPLYFVYLPLVLSFTGVVAWVVGSEVATVIGSFVGSLVGLYLLWDWLIKGGGTRFSTLIPMGLLVGYCLGSFNTWATTTRNGISLGEFTGNDDAVLARGVAAVLISCAISIFFGEIFERPLFGRDFKLHLDDRLYTLIYFGTLLVLASFVTGGSASGTADGGAGGAGVIKSFISWITPSLVVMSVSIFLLTPRGGLRKILIGGAALLLLVSSIVLGRRVLIYTVMETIFFARLVGIRIKGSIPKKVAIFASVGAFVAFGALGFMLLRIAGYGGPNTHRSLFQKIVIASEWVKEGSAFDKAVSSTQSNVKTRTFVIAFFANVLDASSRSTPGLGTDTIGLVQLGIPSALYPEKDKFFNEEHLVDSLYGFSYGDEANSILTAGATDFGLLGVLTFPVIMAWIIRVTLEFMSWRLNQGSTLIVILMVIYVTIQAEGTLTGYVDSLFYGILFSVVFVLFFALPRIRLRN